MSHISAIKLPNNSTYDLKDNNAIAVNQKGAANGVVPLNASSQIDSTYLPSYVDDVVEGYYYNEKFWKESTHTTEITGEAGKIYINLETNPATTYRYSGNAFVEIASGGSVVTITRDLISGTKSATININGTGYDIYSTENTTYTFANGTNGFTVTPSGGTVQTVTVTPSIANNITGSGTNGYIAKFNGADTITNGPAFGSATTTFLRNDGSWAEPSDSKVGQWAISINGWSKILASYNWTAEPTEQITSGNIEGVRFDNDGPAINSSTGMIYAKGYEVLLDTSAASGTDAELTTALTSLGWLNDVID